MTEATNNTSGAVAWQFYQHGEWHNGSERIKDHRKNTETAGIPVRDLYTAPPSAAVVPQCLQHFLDHKFTQLAVFEDGRTPLYLTEEQYNSIRSLLARLNPAPVEQSAMVPEGWRELLRRARKFVEDWDDDSQEFIDLCGDIDNAMLAAAPTPEQPAKEQGHE